MGWRRRAGWRPSLADGCVLLALLLFAALCAYRAALVDGSLGRFSGCSTCLGLSVAANDALLAAALLAAIALSRWVGHRAVRTAIAAMVVVALVAYGVDLVVFRLLAQRLLAADVVRFGSDATALLSVVTPWLGTGEAWLLVSGILGAVLAAAVAIAHGGARPSHAIGWGVGAVALAFAAEAVPRAYYLHDIAVRNLWQVNAELDPRRAYSADFRDALAKRPRPAPACESSRGEDLSVVLVVAESLSAIHSRQVGGLRDYLPELDALARDGSYFPDFIANGYSTEGGLIALLTGRVPIETAGRFGTTMAFTEVETDFHRWLNGRGYRTAFFTTGMLSFGQQGDWARAIGIDHVEGAEHPFYSGMPRGVFGAARDAALVDRFLQWHQAQARTSPFMATVVTVEAHPPYADPGTGGLDEGARIRESDRQIARLARELRARGFFDHGVMIVVGDHRAMTPIPPEERERLGANAAMRVMALALGKTGLPRGALHGNFQQTDLIPSLRHAIGGQSCRSDWQGRFLGPGAAPARYVVYNDPVRRNQVVVVDSDAQYRLLLDGDDTRWIAAAPRGQEADRLRDEINWQRIGRMGEFRR